MKKDKREIACKRETWIRRMCTNLSTIVSKVIQHFLNLGSRCV